MAKSSDPHRFAGKMGIETGPIPIGRWKPQPAVNATAPRKEDAAPNAGKPQTQGIGRRKGKE